MKYFCARGTARLTRDIQRARQVQVEKRYVIGGQGDAEHWNGGEINLLRSKSLGGKSWDSDKSDHRASRKGVSSDNSQALENLEHSSPTYLTADGAYGG